MIADAQDRDALSPLGITSTETANTDETVSSDSKPSWHRYRPTKTALFYPLFAAEAPTDSTNETERFDDSTKEAEESAMGKVNVKPHGWARFAHLIRRRQGTSNSAMQPSPGPALTPIEILTTSERLLDAPPTSKSPDAPAASDRRLETLGNSSGSAGITPVETCATPHGRQSTILVASNKDDLHGSNSTYEMNFAFCADMANEAPSDTENHADHFAFCTNDDLDAGPSGTQNHLELTQTEDATFTLHF